MSEETSLVDYVQNLFVSLSSENEEERNRANELIYNVCSNASHIQNILNTILNDSRAILWSGFIYRSISRWFWYLSMFDLDDFPSAIQIINIFLRYLDNQQFYTRSDYSQLQPSLISTFSTNNFSITCLCEKLSQNFQSTTSHTEQTILYFIEMFNLYFSAFDFHKHSGLTDQYTESRTASFDFVLKTFQSPLCSKLVYEKLILLISKHFGLFKLFIINSGCIQFIFNGISPENPELSALILDYLSSMLRNCVELKESISSIVVANIELIISTKSMKFLSKCLELDLIELNEEFYQIIPSVLGLCSISTDSFEDLWDNIHVLDNSDLIRHYAGKVCYYLANSNIDLFAAWLTSDNITENQELLDNSLYILILIKNKVIGNAEFLEPFVNYAIDTEPTSTVQLSTFLMFLAEFLVLDQETLSNKIHELLVAYFSENTEELMIRTLFYVIEKCNSFNICVFEPELLLNLIELIMPNKSLLMYSLESIFGYIEKDFIGEEHLEAIYTFIVELIKDVFTTEEQEIEELSNVDDMFDIFEVIDVTQPDLIPLDQMNAVADNSALEQIDTTFNQSSVLYNGAINIFIIFYAKYRLQIGDLIDNIIMEMRQLGSDFSWITKLCQKYAEFHGKDEIYNSIVQLIRN